jgi:hypothetical protein
MAQGRVAADEGAKRKAHGAWRMAQRAEESEREKREAALRLLGVVGGESRRCLGGLRVLGERTATHELIGLSCRTLLDDQLSYALLRWSVAVRRTRPFSSSIS